MLIPVVVAFVIITIIEIIRIFLKKRINKQYFYKFYTDRLVYRNSYFGKKDKEIRYEDFKEIRYSQGFIQSKFNVGEIYISTNSKNVLNRLLILKLIPDIEENYEKIVNLFNT